MPGRLTYREIRGGIGEFPCYRTGLRNQEECGFLTTGKMQTQRGSDLPRSKGAAMLKEKRMPNGVMRKRKKRKRGERRGFWKELQNEGHLQIIMRKGERNSAVSSDNVNESSRSSSRKKEKSGEADLCRIAARGTAQGGEVSFFEKNPAA